jgi:hypothetical protein
MKEDIIRMAREVNNGKVRVWEDCHLLYPDELERFAALVAAAERKRFYGQDKPAECAKGCPPKQLCDYCQVVEPVRAMILAEREACAKVCEEPGWNAANWCAKKIRARGQA